jgi:ribosome-associated protein
VFRNQMIQVTSTIRIDESEIETVFVRASGPGGQNVNKVSTACQLRFNAAGSPALSPEALLRLRTLAGRKMTDEGLLIIDARRHRTQSQNRQDAMDRLIDLLRRAAEAPRPRHKTRPTAASRRRRLTDKKLRGAIKSLRRLPADQQ